MNRPLLLRYQLLIGLCLLAAVLYPVFFSSRSVLMLLTQTFILAVFAMSYNLLLGYTGIVSFGHAAYFGIGAYTIGITLKRLGNDLPSFFLAILIIVLLTAALSYLVGMLTLRLQSHYFAMLTMAIAGLLLVLAEKWRTLTMGNDGFTFSVPDIFKDRTSFYIITFTFMLISYFIIKRFINSPAGKVITAIRENEKRAESIGYQTIHYKIAANIMSGIFAGLSGMFYGISLRFVNTSVFSTEMTLDALLMTIIGGTGTLLGPIVGAGIIEAARYWLMELAKVHWIFERWIILFGIVYILVVLFFPKGIVGTLQNYARMKIRKIQLKRKAAEGRKAA